MHIAFSFSLAGVMSDIAIYNISDDQCSGTERVLKVGCKDGGDGAQELWWGGFGGSLARMGGSPGTLPSPLPVPEHLFVALPHPAGWGHVILRLLQTFFISIRLSHLCLGPVGQ